MTGLYPIEIGGPASVSYYISRELGRAGDDVTLLTRTRTKEQAQQLRHAEEISGLENVRVQAFRVDYSFPNLLNLPMLLYKIHETTKGFTERRYDIVHYNSPPVDAAILLPMQAKRRHERQTLAIHGGLFYESKNILGRNIIKAEKNWFDRTVVLNRFSREIALKAGIEEDRLVTIPNGVDLDALEKAEPLELIGEPRILFTGRLVEVKGVHLLLEAFKSVLAEHHKARLYVIGDGPLIKQLKELAERLNICEEVFFKGFITKTTDVHRYYKSTDLLVLPSLMENFSITLLEAMAAHLPVLASDVEGNRGIISDGENGTLFTCGDSGDLARKMLALLSDPLPRRRMAEMAYEGVKENFTWSKVAQAYRGMFNSVLDAN